MGTGANKTFRISRNLKIRKENNKMADQIKFKSIAHGDKQAYILEPDRWNYNAPPARLHDTALKYDTYGDSNTQHSPSYYVLSDDAIDYLYSLTAYLQATADPELIKNIGYKFSNPAHVSINTVKFYLSLKYDPEKTTYYNAVNQKTSRNPNKQHDKRWNTIPETADGTLDAVYTLLMTQRGYFTGQIDKYAILIGIYNAIEKITGQCEYIDAEKYQLPASYHEIATAYNTLIDFIKAHETLEFTGRHIDNYINNLDWKRKQEENAGQNAGNQTEETAPDTEPIEAEV